MVGSVPTDGAQAAQPCPLRSLALLPPMLRVFVGLATGVDSVDLLPKPCQHNRGEGSASWTPWLVLCSDGCLVRPLWRTIVVHALLPMLLLPWR